jgi:N-acetylglucosaminyl-diphospho-decaprenol L-rhamnosyltransferase
MSGAPIAVVTVAYHSDAVLPAFVASLGAASVHELQVEIVDNGEIPATLPPSPRDGVTVELVRPGANLGYGSAINRGAREAPDAAWIFGVNPDLTVSPGAIDRLIEVAESDARIGIIGPLILTAEGEVYPSARRLPSLRTGVGHAIFNRVWPSNPWTVSYHADRELPPRQRDTGWLSGAALLIRADAFRQLGGFDEGFFMYFEDVDLSARASRAGWRVVYAPSAEVVHLGAHSTGGAVSRRMIRAHHASAYRYLAAKYHGWYLWPLRVVLRAGLAVRSRVVKG